MRGLYRLRLIPGTRRVVRAALLPRGRQLPACPGMFSVLSSTQLRHETPPLAAKRQGEIWFSWTPLCLIAFICLNASWKNMRKKVHSAPVTLTSSGISPQWKKTDFCVLKTNNGGRGKAPWRRESLQLLPM